MAVDQPEDAIHMLKAEHRNVQALLHQYDAVADPSLKRQIAAHTFTALELHAELEAMVFYPAFELHAIERGRQIVDESLQEHGVMALLIEEMRGLASDDPAFHATFEALRDHVEGHIAQEETFLLPEAEEVLLEQAEALWVAMREFKRQLLLPEP